MIKFECSYCGKKAAHTDNEGHFACGNCMCIHPATWKAADPVSPEMAKQLKEMLATPFEDDEVEDDE